MNYKSFLLRCFVVSILVGCAITASAQTLNSNQNQNSETQQQEETSVQTSKKQLKFSSNNCSSTHELRPVEIIVPTLLAGSSAIFLCDGATDVKHRAHNYLSACGKHKITVDDYLQYGVQGAHKFKDKTIMLAMSYATMGVAVNAIKYSVGAPRPDGSAFNSFPSGHTATAFMAAEFLNKEYKSVSPWIGYAGYTVAAVTGYLRIYNNRHYFNDVIAGACIGVMSVKLSYWLYPKIFNKSDCNDKRMAVNILPYCGYNSGGLSINVALQHTNHYKRHAVAFRNIFDNKID